MKMDFGNERKGQSAIEYLTTYGWMLLVVAIVGGAIFTTVQNQSNLQTVSGFSGSSVGINTFALTGNGELAMEITAKGSEPVKITGVSINNPSIDGVDGKASNSSVDTSYIPLGESKQVTIPNVSEGDSSSQYDVKIDYSTRSLSGLQASGALSGSFDLTG